MKKFKKVLILLAISALTSTNVFATIDPATGGGNGISTGTGSSAPKSENVAIGKNAIIKYSNGASNATGDIAIGSGSYIDNYASQGGSIALGSNARIENMAGGAEAAFPFGQTTYSGGFFSAARIPTDPTKALGSIAIGQNSFARTGSTMIGIHNYAGELGDTTVDSSQTRKDNLHIYATTIGANSNSNGAFTSLTGAYSIISSNYNGGRFANPLKNMGATITGSLNSIESMSGNRYAGMANSITGVANRINNSNGSLIYGAGNTITNSFTELDNAPTDSGNSAKAFQAALISMVKGNDGGGSTMAFGGGNTADYTQKTAIIGVNNTVTGTDSNIAKLNFVSGFKNTVTNASNNIVMGNDHTITADNNIAIGGLSSSDTRSTVNGTSIGYDSKVSVEGGVAIGYQSVSDRNANSTGGYNMTTKTTYTDGTPTWNSTAGAVSVGDVENGITRQITSVAAGKDDTDAVNVAQLKTAISGSQVTITAGNGISLDGSQGNNFVISATGISAQPTKYAGDTGNVTINNGSPLNVKGGATDLTDNNIGVVANGDTLNIKLSKDIQGLNSVTTKEITADKGTIDKGIINNLTATTITAGDTTINNNGVIINNGPSITNNGIDANNTIIRNVGNGSISPNSTDAVNGGQLYNVSSRVNTLGREVRKIGAGAAALAGLHPMDFDSDEKFNVAVSGGFYKDKKSLALGAFYHPNEETLFSVASTIGNDDNMVNIGVSFKVGETTRERKLKEKYKTSPISTVYVLEAEIEKLKEENKKQRERDNERISKLESLVAQLMAK